MRIDIGSVIAVLRTASSYEDVFVTHDGAEIHLREYVDLLEAAHADPTQSVLVAFTPERIGVVSHEAGE